MHLALSLLPVLTSYDLFQVDVEKKRSEIESLIQSSEQTKAILDSNTTELARLTSISEEQYAQLQQQTLDLEEIRRNHELAVEERNALAKDKDDVTAR